MNRRSPKFEDADRLRKNKQFAKAIPLFADLWKTEPSPYVGWRYASCLRKANQPDQAVEIMRQARSQYPNDKYTLGELIDCLRAAGELEEAEQIARQALGLFPDDRHISDRLIWVLYDKKLKPAKEDSDLDQILQSAEEILVLGPNDLALRLIVQAVMKVAKEQNNAKWDVILRWSDKATPEVFETSPNEYNGKTWMSDRETYYIGRSRALLELKRYEEARQQAENGLRDFPNSFFLKRIVALSLAGLGNTQEAVVEMRELQKHPRCDWYAKAELAGMEYSLGHHAEAFRLMCDALQSTRQGAQYKLGHFVMLANIAVTLRKPDVAAAHVQLAKVVRTNRSWSIPLELFQAERDTEELLETLEQSWPDLPDDEVELSRICEKLWREAATGDLERKEGILLGLPPGKSYTFIKPDDGSENVFVHQRNLPRRSHEGMRVDFALKPSFDRKKNRESFEAVDVRVLR